MRPPAVPPLMPTPVTLPRTSAATPRDSARPIWPRLEPAEAAGDVALAAPEPAPPRGSPKCRSAGLRAARKAAVTAAAAKATATATTRSAASAATGRL